MARRRNISPAALPAAMLLAVADLVHAWFGTFPRVDLSCPVPEAASDLVINGNILDPAPPGTQSINWDGFPCANVTIPTNVVRTPFPLLGGAIQLNFTAPDPTQTVNGTTSWIIYWYFGQFGGNTTVAPDTYAYIDTFAWNSTQWALGTWSSQGAEWPTLNLTAKFAENELLNPAPDELDGLEATLGVALMQFGGPVGDQYQNEEAQCVYVRFTSDPVSTSFCGSETIKTTPAGGGEPSSSVSPFGSASTGNSGLFPSGTSRPVATSAAAAWAAGPTGSVTNSRAVSLGVGLGVGVTCGAALLILAVRLLLIRRQWRREQRAGKQVELLPMPPDEKDGMFKEQPPNKKKIEVADVKSKDSKGGLDAKAKDVDDGSSIASGRETASIHSEQLPSYPEAVAAPRAAHER